MAAAATQNEELPNFEEFKRLPLKAKYNEAQKWSQEQWEFTPYKDSKFKRLCSSARFWRVKLLEAFSETNVILTLHSEVSNKFLTSMQIVDEIERQFPGIGIVGYNRFRNPRYLCIDFLDASMRNAVLEGLRLVGDFEVLFLSWAPMNANLVIRVHWLPKKTETARIATALNRYFTCKFVKLETAVHGNGKAYGCGITTFTGQLKPGVSMAQVPHTVYIGGLESLWTIPSRLPLCLQCDTVGHRAAECTVSFCGRCRRRKPKGHECVEPGRDSETYAQKVKQADVGADDRDDYDFSSSDILAGEEAHNKALPIKIDQRALPSVVNTSVNNKANKIKKNPSANSKNVELPSDTKAEKQVPQALSVGEGLPTVTGNDENLMDFEDAFNLLSQAGEEEEFTQVQKKGKLVKQKDGKAAEKERATKVPLSQSAIARAANKPYTRSGGGAHLISKQEEVSGKHPSASGTGN